MNDLAHNNSLNQLVPRVDAASNVVIYGNKRQTTPIRDFLADRGKQVGVIDLTNKPSDATSKIGQVITEGALAIIASYDELWIAQRLTRDLGFQINRDYILGSHLESATLGLMDVCGLEFCDIVSEHLAEITAVRELLSDNRSREMFDKVIYLRKNAFLPESIDFSRLPISHEAHLQYARKAEHFIAQLPAGLPEELKVSIGFKIAIDPYTYQSRVRPRNNATILNCGAHGGSSTGMFCWICPSATVYGFEPGKDAWRSHQALEDFFPRVHSINQGVWSASTSLSFGTARNTFCGSSSARIGEGNQVIDVVAIDEFVVTRGLASVDFIKMDIEGAELEALAGASNVIRSYQPDLAIALYHKASHLWEIPLLVKQLNPDYEIYIDHKYASTSETVCFATNNSNSLGS